MNGISKANKIFKFNGFGGIDTVRCHTDGRHARDIVNFRICEDGSLKKREGYRRICTLEDGVRAVWSGVYEGESVIFALSGDTIFKISPTSGELTTVSRLTSREGKAEFFFYRGVLYLIHGHGLCGIRNGEIFEPFGYVPLVGKDWSDFKRGEPYEARNLLNDRGRISYTVSAEPLSILHLDDEVSSIDAVYINGSLVSTDRYSVSKSVPILNISGLKAFDRVEVYFTYLNCPLSDNELGACTRAFVFGGINTSRPFLFGGNDRSVTFSGAYVSESSLDSARVVYPQSDALYFPYGHEFTVGDGRFPISSISRHYDRMLIFTKGGAWMADSSSCATEEFPVMSINSSVGVSSDHGATLLENFPYTVSNSGIYRWTADTDELNDCNAHRISAPVDDRLSPDFLSSAYVFANKKRREILFSSPSACKHTLVYSAVTSQWTSFAGIDADEFFEIDGETAFVRGSGIFVFDEAMTTDDGEEIAAYFTSGDVDLGSYDVKRTSEAFLTHENGEVILEITADGKAYGTSQAVFYSEQSHTLTRRRLLSGRFRHACFKLRAVGNTRHTLHSLAIGFRTRK